MPGHLPPPLRVRERAGALGPDRRVAAKGGASRGQAGAPFTPAPGLQPTRTG